jgi:ribosomal protein L11 methyltransferase
MLELFPQGFEERESKHGIELAAYADTADETRMRAAFPEVTSVEVEGGWEERWREFHRGVQIGGLWVGPPWLRAPDGVAAVLIEPGRAFGTGAHATTRLCIELLAELPRSSLLDVGCGSGVLAVAGSKLGYAPVVALDSDPLAVEATRANAARNGVQIDVVPANALERELPAAETTVANLTLDSVRELAPRVRSARFVTSGYLTAELPDLPGRTRVRRAELEGWAADIWG